MNATNHDKQTDGSSNILIAKEKLGKLSEHWMKYWKDYEDNLGVKLGKACYQHGERPTVSTLAVAVGRMANAFAIGEKKSTKAASDNGRTDLWVSISDTNFSIEAKQVRNRVSTSEDELLNSFIDGKHSLVSQGIRDYLHTTSSENHDRIRTRRVGDNWYIMLLISLYQCDKINESIIETELRGKVFNKKVNIHKNLSNETTRFDLGRYPTVFSIHHPMQDRELPGCVASMTILGKI